MSRGETALLVALIVIGALLSTVVLRIKDGADRSLCEPLYRAAATQTDTVRVDQQVAPRQRGREQNTPSPTCGELRRLSESNKP